MKAKWLLPLLIIGIVFLLLAIIAGPIILLLRMTEGGGYSG